MENQNNQIAKIESNNSVSLITDSELLMHLDNLGLTSKLTEGEKNTYLQIAKSFNLNPFKREIHVSKYGEGSYAKMSIITGYEVYIKRAERSGLLDGWDCKTEGTVKDNDLKAIITIYRKDRKFPFVHEVYYSEYVQKTKTGSITQFWEKAITMIKKVAMSQGFRLCFSDELGGMPYTSEEMPEQTHDIRYEEIKSTVTVIPEIFKTLEERIKDAENLLNDVNSESEMVAIYKALPTDLKANQSIINLCAEIKLYYNPITN